MSNPDLEQLGLQQDMPDVPPPWVDASDLLLQAERLTLSPPAASGRVGTLQELVCTFLARHLHTLALLDDLPEHLAATVRASIRRDRSLLSDDGLGVWLDAVLETGDTRQLSLRWAQGLTDSGLGQLRSRGEWASTLVAFDACRVRLRVSHPNPNGPSSNPDPNPNGPTLTQTLTAHP